MRRALMTAAVLGELSLAQTVAAQYKTVSVTGQYIQIRAGFRF